MEEYIKDYEAEKIEFEKRHTNVIDFERDFPEIPPGVIAKGFRISTDSTLNTKVVVVRPGENIQQAINIVSNAGGGTVILTKGTHKPTAHITVLSVESVEIRNPLCFLLDAVRSQECLCAMRGDFLS